jgi:hypothetical protein
MKTELKAYIVSGVVILGVAVFGSGYVYNQFNDASVSEQVDISTGGSTMMPEEKLPISEDDAATISQDYIEQLSFVEELKDKPVLLENVEEIDHNKYQANFFLQTDEVIKYRISTEVDSGHVIGHTVQVSDKYETLTVVEPEPNELISAPSFNVKGQTKEQEVVIIFLYAFTGEKLEEYFIDQTITGSNLFSQKIETKKFEPGTYFLEVRIGDIPLIYPIVISPYSV